MNLERVAMARLPTAILARTALAALAALALTELLWEWTWAPLRPGGSWLALKALPLALAWIGCASGSLRVWRLALLILPFYFAEALVAALARSGRAQLVAGWAALLAAGCFAAAWLFLRRALSRDVDPPSPGSTGPWVTGTPPPR